MSLPSLLTIHAGPHARRQSPVSLFLPHDRGETSAGLGLVSPSGLRLPVQQRPHEGGVELTFLAPELKPGEEWTCRLEPLEESPLGVEMRLDEDAGGLDIVVQGELFTTYHFGSSWVRPFFHPVIGPGGVRVTRDWPVEDGPAGETRDHPHHKSIWVAHGECDEVDNWSEEPGHGWQRHQRFNEIISGPVYGQFTACNDWCAHDGRKQFEETRTIRVYALPDNARMMDVTVAFHMTEGPVTFRDTKEGGLLAVRVASKLDVPETGCIENGYGGINEGETWGKRAPWCDYNGLVNGQRVGVAIMDHEENPRYPTWWHARDYGLMTANCFAWSHYKPDAGLRGDMHFERGSQTTWRYRLFVHRGDATQGLVKDKFMDFIAPPLITIT